MMDLLHRIGALGSGLERLVQLGQIFKFNHDVKLAQPIGPKAQLAAGQTVFHGHAIGFQVAQESVEVSGKVGIPHAVLQIDPNMVNIHGRALSLDTGGRRIIRDQPYNNGY